MEMFFGKIMLLVALIVLLWMIFHFTSILRAPSVVQPTVQQNPLSSVCIKNNCFQVELATTPATRDRGLMYRKELDQNKGMLFIFDNMGIYPFWMENTLIPLDMIWIDNSYKIVFIGQNVQPCHSLICPSVIPSAQAKYVLEINAGICQKIGLKIGDVAQFNLK